MPAPIDRQAIRSVTEIFDSLGAVFLDHKIYGPGHPRFRKTQERAQGLVSAHMATRSAATAIVFTLTEESVEYQRIPLVDLQAQGQKLAGALVASGAGALQVDRGIEPEDLAALAVAVASRARAPTKEAQPSHAGGRFRIISREDARAFAEAAGRLELGGAPSDVVLPQVSVSESTLETVLTSYRDLASSAEHGRVLDYAGLRETTDSVVRAFGGVSSSLPVAHGYFDDFTFHHSVNVCLITTRVASFIVKDPVLLGRISMAALLHDIGKARVPAEIIHKPGRLTPSEIDLMRRHPVLGAETLLSTESMDPLCVGVAFGHHTFGGKQAYPKTSMPFRADWITQLISVVDIYEALTAIRPYKKAISSPQAFEVMLSMPGFRDRLPIIKVIFDLIGPYPVGAVVELSTGERAVVLEQNAGTPYEPRLRILTDSNRVPLPIPRELDLATQAGDDRLTVKEVVVVQSSSEDPLRTDAKGDSGQIVRETLGNAEALLLHEA